jgi:hypothetical protein
MIVVVIPALFGLPTMLFSVPPLMVLIPTVSAFGVQIPAAALGLSAVIAMVVDGFVEVRLRFFNGMLAVRPLIGVRPRRGRYEEQKRPYH